jgi:pimeloyl-ACP methyl ester carboxylesterase
MTPLYFGRDQKLFGVSHAPGAASGPKAGVVLCYPYGQDYIYAFRAFRTLATRLARGGFYVLRFDYSGTGDSADDVESASVSQWTADVSDAVDQVRSKGCSDLSLVGFRLGATLATNAAVQCGGIERLVLWDPVIDGTEYVSALMKHHRGWFQELARQVPRSRKLATPEDLLGFRFTEKLRADLARLNLLKLDARPARDVLILSTEDQGGCFELSRRFRELGGHVDLKLVEDQKLPYMVPGLQIGLVPNRALTEIDGWLRAPANA